MPYCKRHEAIVHRDTCLDECEYGRGGGCSYKTKKLCGRCKKELHKSEENFGVCDECAEYICKLKRERKQMAKWCNKYNMWCIDVEELTDEENDCDMDCADCDELEEVK